MTLHSEPAAPSFHEELLLIYADADVRKFALRRAGHRDLAEDALQETYVSVSRVKDPGRIRDLRAFFCRALVNEINHQRGQQTAIPVEDPALAAASGPALTWPGHLAHQPVEESVIWLILAATWLSRFRDDRRRLESRVTGRSPDPGRYRQVIVAMAEQLLHDVSGRVNWADINQALQETYPRWFEEPGCDADTGYQRLSRARRDVRLLLQSIVDQADLRP
jgi:hypothetical protein